jgi:hypothetical protein
MIKRMSLSNEKKAFQEKTEQWFMPVILATHEVKIWRIMVGGQPRKQVSETPISTNKVWASSQPRGKCT